MEKLQERLDQIAGLIYPCPAPDVANGYDLCPTHPGWPWPCYNTKAAWIAQGLDEKAEVKAAMDQAMAHLTET